MILHRVSSNEKQRDYKIFDTDMNSLLMSALVNDIDHINKLEFDGDSRTKTHLNVSELAQQLLKIHHVVSNYNRSSKPH